MIRIYIMYGTLNAIVLGSFEIGSLGQKLVLTIILHLDSLIVVMLLPTLGELMSLLLMV